LVLLSLFFFFFFPGIGRHHTLDYGTFIQMPLPAYCIFPGRCPRPPAEPQSMLVRTIGPPALSPFPSTSPLVVTTADALGGTFTIIRGLLSGKSCEYLLSDSPPLCNRVLSPVIASPPACLGPLCQMANALRSATVPFFFRRVLLLFLFVPFATRARPTARLFF